MTHIPGVWKAGFVILPLLFLSVVPFLVVGASPHASAAQSGPCSAPAYRSFDFFAGDWDAFEIDNPTKAVARNHVMRILDDCVLLEDYQGTNGSHGQSFTIFDSTRNVWHQTWVTNHGALLTIEGNMRGDEMVLDGTDHAADGKERRVRGIWKPVSGGVLETAVTSTDGGKTWTSWFDLMFRPARQSGSPADAPSGRNSVDDDKTVIAALDSQYQAAVKINDAATMDRILADDFVLVTGSGKAYTKADLLEEARGGRIVYEHQEDTAQVVHVWGDSAVVTAKLWEKGTNSGKAFDYTVWFSDTYLRTPGGWRYVFGQSSLPLSKAGS